jgi:hypothetical protein
MAVGLMAVGLRRFGRGLDVLLGAAVVVWVATGCGAAAPPANAEYPALVLPAHSPPSAAPKRSEPVTPAPSSTSLSTLPPAPNDGGKSFTVHTLHGDLPDPEPLTERAWWSFPVTYDRGAIRVGEPELVCLPRPQPTPRRIGRFAFELWVGRELVDRLRFDFPLLATEEPAEGGRKPLHETPRFAPGARVSVTLRLPATDRPSSARVFDRATGDAIAVTWPPQRARPRDCPAAGPSGKAAGARTGPGDAGR